MIGSQGGWLGVNIGAQGAVHRQMLGTQNEDAANGGQDGASDGVAAAAMSNDFAAFTVFLVIKRKGDVGGMAQISGGGREEIQAGGPNEQGDVGKAKGVVVRRNAVFARAEKEKEGQPCHVDCSLAQGAGRSDGLGPVENLNGQRFDTGRGRVSVFIGRIQCR